MTFSGTKAAVNAALAGMTFTSATVGATTLTSPPATLAPRVPADTLTDADTVTINVAPQARRCSI